MKHDGNRLDGMNRRQALGGGLAALAGASVLGRRGWALAPGGDDSSSRRLLLVQLTGGNDGLSMVVPHGDDAYYEARGPLAIDPKEVLGLDDYRGLHPELRGLREVYERGQLALVEGVGYPNPVRSHFKSFEIWHTADPRGRAAGDGWLGRLCDHAWSQEPDPNRMVHVGARAPYSLHSSKSPAVAFSSPATYRWAGDAAERETLEEIGSREGASPVSRQLDFLRQTLADGQTSSDTIRRAALGYRTGVRYPTDPFGLALRDVAALAKANLGSRVFSVELGGFDTHSDQDTRYPALMRSLDGGLSAFLEDLSSSSVAGELLVVVYSEFGRRVHANGSGGTDHGVAGPLLVCGAPVKGGLYGESPSLTELSEGDLTHTTDFRSVYGTLIESWFGEDQAAVLGARYPVLDLV